jgi:hypothetical protein
MELIERYEKEGNVIEVNSLLTTNDSVVDIKQIFRLGNVTYVSFDTELKRVLITETADAFIQKNKEYLVTLTKKVNNNSCKCENCH